MDSEEHDDLWQLLGKARQPEVSPFFTRNVLRSIRQSEAEPGMSEQLGKWWRRQWRVVATAACALLIAGSASLHLRENAADPVMLLAWDFSDSADYQVVSHLDELMDSERNSVWLEN